MKSILSKFFRNLFDKVSKQVINDTKVFDVRNDGEMKIMEMMFDRK